MKKIAFVITDLSYGGAQTMLIQLIENIDYSEYLVEVFVRESKLGTDIESKLELMGVNCHYLKLNDNNFDGSKIIHKIKSFKRFRHELNRFNPDFVHSHLDCFYSPLYCILGKVKFIFTIHSFPTRIMSKQFKLFLNLLRRTNKLSIVGCAKCVSDNAIELLGSKYNGYITTIYNPINCRSYNLTPVRNGNTFIHIGRMDPIKNQKLLIDSFADFAKKYTKCKLLMIGDGDLRECLESYVVDNDLSENIVFLGNRKDIAELLSKSDCFIMTSESECCPMSILEAMASGLPIISTDVGGIKEIAGESAIFVEDKQSIVNALEKIYTDEQLRYSLGKISEKNSLYYDSKLISIEYAKLYS